MKNYNINKIPGWYIPWDSPCKSSRKLLQAMIIADVYCGKPVKWGGKWDVAFPDGRMVKTNQYCLSNWTYADWIDWCRKEAKNNGPIKEHEIKIVENWHK